MIFELRTDIIGKVLLGGGEEHSNCCLYSRSTIIPLLRGRAWAENMAQVR